MIRICARVTCFIRGDLLFGARFCTSAKVENVRVRFAPSPTGHVHLGGLRTALYNHLFAKSQNGATILRIEDTDQSRVVPGATEKIIEDLKWCGITFDEGPYFQSERTELYKKHAQILLDKGDAYYCFCSTERLDLMRKVARKNGEVVKYDNKCRHLTKEEAEEKLGNGESYCIRFKMNDAIKGFEDMIFGYKTVEISQQEGDPIIIKSDGYPTYHLANVVDDHLMNISHVLRGSEWLISTTKHLLMYRAFNWTPPKYGHLPLLLNSDGTKFSKRQNDLSVGYFKANNIFPNSVINLVTYAGGGFNIAHSERSEKNFSLEEFIEKFDMSKVNKSSCKLPMEWLDRSNNLEIRRMLQDKTDRKILAQEVKDHIKNYFSIRDKNVELELDIDYILKVLDVISPRIHRFDDLTKEGLNFFWVKPTYKLTDDGSIPVKKFELMISELAELKWEEESLKHFFKDFANREDISYRDVMTTLRQILSGLKKGPTIVEILTLLGRENSISRLKSSITIDGPSS